jgi:hypothetical protein
VAAVVAVTPTDVPVVAGEGDPSVVRQHRDLVAERARASRRAQISQNMAPVASPHKEVKSAPNGGYGAFAN